MQLLKKRRYLARNIRALRCRIRYNPESIRRVVAETVFRVILTAIRTSLARTATAMADGSMLTMIILSIGGITTMGSRSSPRNSLHFSPYLCGGEFCFISCPSQPPSIRPISSSGSERAIYFLLSSDFVSQRIIKRTLSVSVFLVAIRTYGCFSVRGRKPAAAIASIISMNKTSIRVPSEYRCGFGNSR